MFDSDIKWCLRVIYRFFLLTRQIYYCHDTSIENHSTGEIYTISYIAGNFPNTRIYWVNINNIG